jgi:hypothetical protein
MYVNWVVRINETECLYCEVRAEFLSIIQVKIFKAFLLLYIRPGLTFRNSPCCPHSVLMCFVWI